MEKALQQAVAHPVYEKMRQSLLLINPQMKTWDALSEQEREQIGQGMDMWLRGLGANEVSEEWYDRSGHFPRAIWDQLPGVDHTHIFGFAALDVISELTKLAEAGLQAGSEQK